MSSSKIIRKKKQKRTYIIKTIIRYAPHSYSNFPFKYKLLSFVRYMFLYSNVCALPGFSAEDKERIKNDFYRECGCAYMGISPNTC